MPAVGAAGVLSCCASASSSQGHCWSAPLPDCSENNKTLVMLCGEPDYTVICYKWAGGAMVAAANSSMAMHSISYNPWSATQLVTVGPTGLHTWTYQEDARQLKADAPMYHVGRWC